TLGTVTGTKELKQTVLLISLDGFRWDYMSKASTPNLDFLVKTGSKAKFIRSVFPTTTYPNHFSLVTGLYPENHGIVANYMYDPVYRGRFNISVTNTTWWSEFGAKPIWTSNEEQGGKSGVLYWPGYNVKFGGRYPTLDVLTPSGNIDIGNQTGRVMSFDKRVQTVVKWFSDERPPNFVALYFEEPDETGHKFGPDSEEVRDEIARLDGIIGKLITKLSSKELLDKINIIVTTDHGMTNTSTDKLINLNDYLDPDEYDIWDASTNIMISPRKGKLQELYTKAKKIPHSTIYKKKDIPPYLHFGHNRRIPELFLLIEEGWTVKRWPIGIKPKVPRGNHGYDTQYRDMGGFLVARGPVFRTGHTVGGFDNVHLYPLLCSVLGIQPRPSNGSI
ncbi:predicted protein, partial [Nematostella vectensis]